MKKLVKAIKQAEAGAKVDDICRDKRPQFCWRDRITINPWCWR